MSTPARKRLMRDFRRLQQDPPQGVNGSPTADNILRWKAVIFGPEDTPWDGGTFKLTLEFTEEYPNRPPLVKFVSAMFHPNIYADGGICLDILQKAWSPIYDVAAVLTSVQSLLSDPNPDSPANAEAARLYGSDRREYNRRVKEAVERSWLEEDREDKEAGGEGGGGGGGGGGQEGEESGAAATAAAAAAAATTTTTTTATGTATANEASRPAAGTNAGKEEEEKEEEEEGGGGSERAKRRWVDGGDDVGGGGGDNKRERHGGKDGGVVEQERNNGNADADAAASLLAPPPGP